MRCSSRKHVYSLVRLELVAVLTISILFAAGCERRRSETQPPQPDPSPRSPEVKAGSHSQSDSRVWCKVQLEGGSGHKQFKSAEDAIINLVVKNTTEKTLHVESRQFEEYVMPIHYVRSPSFDDLVSEKIGSFDGDRVDERWWEILTPLGEEVWKKGEVKTDELPPGGQMNFKVDLGKLIDLSVNGEYWVGFLFPMHDEDGTYANNQITAAYIEVGK